VEVIAADARLREGAGQQDGGHAVSAADVGEHRGGLGRRLVTALAALGRTRHPRVFLRVHPDNAAARRCYAGAGFEPVAPQLAARWNASQPVEYVWLALAT
jgi:ribosomal protein S18 acetylase RimI-like enzyme